MLMYLLSRSYALFCQAISALNFRARLLPFVFHFIRLGVTRGRPLPLRSPVANEIATSERRVTGWIRRPTESLTSSSPPPPNSSCQRLSIELPFRITGDGLSHREGGEMRLCDRKGPRVVRLLFAIPPLDDAAVVLA